jgi:CheY-like chemotaxis protein
VALDNAVAALLRLSRENPDLLILDLNLQGMDGFNLIRCLRSAPEIECTRIVAVSGLPPAEIEARGGLPADVALLPKPIPFDRLASIWSDLPAAESAPATVRMPGSFLPTRS